MQAVAAISLVAAQSLEASLDYFQYHQDFQVAMIASPRRLKARILTMKPYVTICIICNYTHKMQNMQNMHNMQDMHDI